MNRIDSIDHRTFLLINSERSYI